MNRHILVVALASLSACGSGDTVEMENASVGEVAQEMRKADVDQSFVNPGKWKQTATLVEIDAPGMPPQVAEAMKKSMGTSQVHETCLTPRKRRTRARTSSPAPTRTAGTSTSNGATGRST